MKNKEIITYSALSDMGKQRTNNEDAYIAENLDENTIIAAAIDGVGGYEGGEVAAEIAQKEIPKYLKEFRNGERLELHKQAVVCANNAIFERRQTDAERPNMSCVLTSALIDRGRKVIDMVHVGDTRLYQYHHGTLRKLSHDHSLIGYREEVGDLTEEQAMHHPQRNVISRDVGSAMHEVADRDFLEAEEFPLLPNSILLFCSDGLTDLITSKQIVSILEQKKKLKEKTKELVDAANEAGGKDNITVVLVEYLAEEDAMPKFEEPDRAPEEKNKEEKTLVDNKEDKKKDYKKLNYILGGALALFLLACVGLIVLTAIQNSRVKDLEKKLDEKQKLIDVLRPQEEGAEACQYSGLPFCTIFKLDTINPNIIFPNAVNDSRSVHNDTNSTYCILR